MRKVIFVLGVLLLAWLLTGVTQVQPGERAVVRRFGRILDFKPGPGLYVGLPWGLERVDRVPIGLDRRIIVGHNLKESDEDANVTPAGQLLTGDHNLVNLQVEIYYTVVENQVEKYVVQGEQQVDGLIGRAAETLLAEWVAGRDVDEVLLRGKALLPRYLIARLEERIAAYDLGVKIEAASVPYLFPPNEVKDAFDGVARAQTEIRTQVNDAEREANRKLSQAEAEIFRWQRLTTAYANEKDLQARAEAENFVKRLAQYRQLRRQNPHYLAAVWWDEISRLFARLRENGRLDVLDNYLSGDGLNITQMPLLPRKK